MAGFVHDIVGDQNSKGCGGSHWYKSVCGWLVQLFFSLEVSVRKHNQNGSLKVVSHLVFVTSVGQSSTSSLYTIVSLTISSSNLFYH